VTLEQVEKRKQKGADFARNVLRDDDLADSLEAEDAYDYALRMRLKISNSAGRRQAVMANGNNGGNSSDYDFSDWTKQDCVDALNQVAQIADEAFDPMSSREDLAGALGHILDALNGDGDKDVDDLDDED
jgi:hypothetical protein